MGRAIEAFELLKDGDRIMCAVSGGKDSYAMHALLTSLQKRSPIKFEVIAVNLDQGHPGYPGHLLTDYMAQKGHAFRMVHEDTYSIVQEKTPPGKTTCSLCSRLRRGILYTLAEEMGCTKIALGHHRDDSIITLMMNLFFEGQLKAMPPILTSDDKKNTVIRPLIYCAERDITEYAAKMEFPIIPCDLCGSQENHQRKQMNRLLQDLEKTHPHVRQSMMAALGNVRPTHLVDAKIWRRLGLDLAPAESADGPQPIRDFDTEVVQLRVPSRAEA